MTRDHIDAVAEEVSREAARPAKANARTRQARLRAERLRPLVEPLVNQGATLREIAAFLVRSGIPTARGGRRWHHRCVDVLLQRLNLKPLSASVRSCSLREALTGAPPVSEALAAAIEAAGRALAS